MAVAFAGPYASLHLIPDNHANIPPLSFLQAGYPSCRPTNSVKALKDKALKERIYKLNLQKNTESPKTADSSPVPQNIVDIDASEWHILTASKQ